jgi:hypothetical protein
MHHQGSALIYINQGSSATGPSMNTQLPSSFPAAHPHPYVVPDVFLFVAQDPSNEELVIR